MVDMLSKRATCTCSELACIRAEVVIEPACKRTNKMLTGSLTRAVPEQPDTLPERLQHIIKGFNAVWRSSFCQGSNGQGCDGLHLLVLIYQTMLDDVH